MSAYRVDMKKRVIALAVIASTKIIINTAIIAHLTTINRYRL